MLESIPDNAVDRAIIDIKCLIRLAGATSNADLVSFVVTMREARNNICVCDLTLILTLTLTLMGGSR